jgi:hypothetical protein
VLECSLGVIRCGELYFSHYLWVNYDGGRRVCDPVFRFGDGTGEEGMNVPWLVDASLDQLFLIQVYEGD